MSSSSSTPVPVLLLVRALGIGGSERQLVETARFLQRERFAPHVGCFRPDGLRRADLERAGVPILHLPVYSFRSTAVVTAASRLIRYIRQHHIQVVHSFDAPLNMFAVPIARFAGVPAVISSQRGHRDLTGGVTKFCLRVSDRLTDAVVVNCDAMRRHLVDDEGVPESKIRICYNAVDVDQFKRRATVSPWPGKPVIGVVCALRPEKGLDTLLRAFAMLSRQDAMLAIVGSGPELPRLTALALELGIAARCHFEPATSEVAEWLSRIDIFVLPSRTEALSNALMEAMACACCPIATRVGGNPELIDDGGNGLLFEVDNVEQLAAQMEELLADPERRQRMAAAASAKMASRFTHAQAASTMQEIYDLVLLNAQRKGRFLPQSNG
jgi:glycosyltransferase involved in cell wall biosynthesis